MKLSSASAKGTVSLPASLRQGNVPRIYMAVQTSASSRGNGSGGWGEERQIFRVRDVLQLIWLVGRTCITDSLPLLRSRPAAVSEYMSVEGLALVRDVRWVASGALYVEFDSILSAAAIYKQLTEYSSDGDVSRSSSFITSSSRTGRFPLFRYFSVETGFCYRSFQDMSAIELSHIAVEGAVDRLCARLVTTVVLPPEDTRWASCMSARRTLSSGSLLDRGEGYDAGQKSLLDMTDIRWDEDEDGDEDDEKEDSEDKEGGDVHRVERNVGRHHSCATQGKPDQHEHEGRSGHGEEKPGASIMCAVGSSPPNTGATTLTPGDFSEWDAFIASRRVKLSASSERYSAPRGNAKATLALSVAPSVSIDAWRRQQQQHLSPEQASKPFLDVLGALADGDDYIEPYPEHESESCERGEESDGEHSGSAPSSSSQLLATTLSPLWSDGPALCREVRSLEMVERSVMCDVDALLAVRARTIPRPVLLPSAPSDRSDLVLPSGSDGDEEHESSRQPAPICSECFAVGRDSPMPGCVLCETLLLSLLESNTGK